MSSNYRYPGVTPFRTEQSAVFFGRTQDTKELYRLIRREPLVVLYGKSGLGKSSLLNAGIIPACIEENLYAPVIIRFGAWTEESSMSPLGIMKAILSKGYAQDTLLQQLLPEDQSLWRFIKNRQLLAGEYPLLLFDQFEELFTYPESDVLSFQQELAELLHTDIPLRFRRQLDLLENLSDDLEERLENPLKARIVLAIRSDRIHLLHRLKAYMPNILRHCFELRALSHQDARDAIERPAQTQGDFATKPFVFEPAATDKLLAFLEDGTERRVEAILLQMLCEYYERKLVAGEGHLYLNKDHIGDPNSVVERYYEEKIMDLPANYRQAARYLIEDGLVSEGEAMRLTLHEAYILKEFKIDKTLLEKLVDNRLLRAEPFLRGGYTYELSHDRLVAPVLNARNARRMQEAKLEQERLRADAERERRAKERAQRQLQTVWTLLAIALVALVSAGYFWWEADIAKDEAQKSLFNSYKSDIIRLNGEIGIANSKIRSYNIYDAEKDVIDLEKQKIDSLQLLIDSLNKQIKLFEQ